MLCNSCGAEIAEDVLVCHFCGSEVIANAHKEHNREIDKLKNEASWIRNSTVKHDINGINRGIAKILGVIAAFLCAVIAISMVTKTVNGRHEAKRQEKQLQKLESLYQQGDYDGLYDYFYEKCDGRYEGMFMKYEKVCHLNRTLDYVRDNIDEDSIESIKKGYRDDISWVLWNFVEVVCDAEESRGLDYPCEEEAGVVYYEEEAMHALKDVLLLKDSEIQEMMEIVNENSYSDSSLLKKYSDIAIERIKAQWF